MDENLESIFDTEQKRLDALKSFMELKEHPAFDLYMQVYNLFISILDQRLKNEDFKTLEDQKKVMLQRQAYVKARDLLDTMIRDLTPTKQVEQTFDPYRPDPRNQKLDNPEWAN